MVITFLAVPAHGVKDAYRVPLSFRSPVLAILIVIGGQAAVLH